MKTILIFLFALVALPTVGQEFSFTYHTDYPKLLVRTQEKTDRLYYPKQLRRFVQNDTSLTDYEVLALLIGFTADKNYHAYPDLAVERSLYKLNDQGKYREAASKGRLFNKTHPLHQMTLIELSFAYHQLHKPDSSAYFGRQSTASWSPWRSPAPACTPTLPCSRLPPSTGIISSKNTLAQKSAV